MIEKMIEIKMIEKIKMINKKMIEKMINRDDK